MTDPAAPLTWGAAVAGAGPSGSFSFVDKIQGPWPAAAAAAAAAAEEARLAAVSFLLQLQIYWIFLAQISCWAWGGESQDLSCQ